jgi:colicin import membrane protein
MGMIRKRENPVALQSGMLALLVHGVFFAMLVISFSWKNVQPIAVAEVELWDSLPQPQAVTPPPEIKPEPEPEPPPPPPEIKPEPKPEPPPEIKAEIEVKKPPKEEIKKPDPELKKKEEEKKRLEKKKEDFEKLKKAMLEDAPPEHESLPQETKTEAPNPADEKRAADLLGAAGQPSSDELGKHTAKIIAAIQRKVNKQLCGTGKPEPVFRISLMPTGYVTGSPRLVNPSGVAACDQAVEAAILAAQPLPMPPRELFDHLRDLNIKFKPNG